MNSLDPHSDPCRGYYNRPHPTDDETEGQRGRANWPSDTAGERRRWNFDLGLEFQPMPLNENDMEGYNNTLTM